MSGKVSHMSVGVVRLLVIAYGLIAATNRVHPNLPLQVVAREVMVGDS